MTCFEYLNWLQFRLDQTKVWQIDCCRNIKATFGDGFIIVRKTLFKDDIFVTYTRTPLHFILKKAVNDKNNLSVLWVTPNDNTNKSLLLKSGSSKYNKELEEFIVFGKYGEPV